MATMGIFTSLDRFYSLSELSPTHSEITWPITADRGVAAARAGRGILISVTDTPALAPRVCVSPLTRRGATTWSPASTVIRTAWRVEATRIRSVASPDCMSHMTRHGAKLPL
ncbi:hypothetical protein RRG08_045427 [Elysia crispata]|uniref:Uncharacterized protein n=1 Tax=Elysia crispata TaxID=231223 RepID=A0AAE1E658_9GAST|nr:hypothetical protein RRG08_045427 [Elysia crispata]